MGSAGPRFGWAVLLSGVLVTQIVNSPPCIWPSSLLIADPSACWAAPRSCRLGTAVHLVGTYLAHWPTDRFPVRSAGPGGRDPAARCCAGGIPVAMAPRQNRPLGPWLSYRAEGLILG